MRASHRLPLHGEDLQEGSQGIPKMWGVPRTATLWCLHPAERQHRIEKNHRWPLFSSV